MGGSRFAKASLWSLGGTGAAQLLRFGSNLVLWRLLFPEAFGLMALVNSLSIALAMFSDVGVAPSVIQDKNGADKKRLHTAYTIQVARGVAILLVTCIFAVPMARFYGQPELAMYIPIVGLTAVLQGATSMRVITETKNVRMGGVMGITLLSQVMATAVMITWAAIWPSVWALVVGNIVGAASRTLLSFLMLPGQRDGFAWDKDSVKSILGYGRWVFVSTLLTFVATQSDRLLFGKMISLAALGAYAIAQALATMPDQLLTRMVNGVLFPYLSQARNDGKPLDAVFRQRRQTLVLLSGWMCTGLIAAGPPLVMFLYGPKAAMAQWILPALAAGTWLRCLRMGYNSALLAMGRPKWVAISTGAKVAAMVPFIGLGYVWFGFAGAVIGFSASEVVSYLAGLMPLRRHGLWLWRSDLALSAGVLAVSLGSLWWVQQTPNLAPVFQVAVIGAVVTAVWGVAYWMMRKGSSATVSRAKVAMT